MLTLTKFREISHKYSADDYLSIPGHVTSSEMYLHAVYLKKPPFLAKKSVSNFFGSQSGKIKLIFLIYTFFRTSMQKFGDGLIFFFSKGFGLADIRLIRLFECRGEIKSSMQSPKKVLYLRDIAQDHA